MNNSGSNGAVERLNTETARRLNRVAFDLRIEAIDLAYEAIALYLDDDRQSDEDLKSRGYPTGESTGLNVTESMLDAPRHDRPVRTYGILLVAAAAREAIDDEDDELPELEETEIGVIAGVPFSRLKVSIPIQPDNYIEDFTMPPRASIEEVYLEYSSPDGPSHRIAVNKAWMYEYTAPADDTQLAEVFDIAQITEADKSQIIDNEIELITKGLRDVINMRAIPQRYIEMGQDNSHDL